MSSLMSSGGRSGPRARRTWIRQVPESRSRSIGPRHRPWPRCGSPSCPVRCQLSKGGQAGVERDVNDPPERQPAPGRAPVRTRIAFGPVGGMRRAAGSASSSWPARRERGASGDVRDAAQPVDGEFSSHGLTLPIAICSTVYAGTGQPLDSSWNARAKRDRLPFRGSTARRSQAPASPPSPHQMQAPGRIRATAAPSSDRGRRRDARFGTDVAKWILT